MQQTLVELFKLCEIMQACVPVFTLALWLWEHIFAFHGTTRTLPRATHLRQKWSLFTADHIGLTKNIIRRGTTMAGRRSTTSAVKDIQTNAVTSASITSSNPRVATKFSKQNQDIYAEVCKEYWSKYFLIVLKFVTAFH